ncbi:MAG TPA: sugar phosphate isomerase/epimerase family protein [Natronosporangium sp.]|nr:sugar phosphate isomerase/epimerase family protein [Natronosporangium sp.]
MLDIGVNTWVWVAPLTDERLADLVPKVAAMGFDVIELPFQEPGSWDPARAAELLAAHGLGVTVCAGLRPHHDLLTDDPATRDRTGRFLRAAVDAAATVGSRVVAGPLYSPPGRLWLMDAAARRRAVARLGEALRPVADHAAARGVALALEPLNRFETSLLNTVEQTLEVVDAVGSPGCAIALDTFHMNIEERDPAAALRAAGDRLAHVQVCANDRGAPGADHLDWPALRRALEDVGYRGPLVIESFTAEGLETVMAVWRPLADSRDALAAQGLAFLRDLLAGGPRP